MFATSAACNVRASFRSGMVAVAFSALYLTALPASAQIISTSIPQAETSGAQAAEKKFAVHVMGAPVSKWHYNELVGGDWSSTVPVNVPVHFADVGLFSGTPNSKFLFAGEAVVKVAKSISVGGGGWYNKVGSPTYNFDVQTVPLDTTTKNAVGY